MMNLSQFKESDTSYGFVFWQTYTLWSRRVKKELKKCKLTHTQFVILSVIAYLEKSSISISQVDVSSLSKIDVMTVSTSLKTLIKNGYVITTSSHEDTRANILNLSTKGKKIQMEAVQIVEKIDSDFFGNSDINIKDFLENLHKIRKANTFEKL